MPVSEIAESAVGPAERRAEPEWRVLALDDQAEVLTSLRRILRRRGFDVDAYTDPAAALEAVELDSQRYDIVLLDVNMPKMNGLEVLRRVKSLALDLPVVMLTADSTAETAVSALKAGAFSYLTKPLDDPDAISISLVKAGHHGRLQRRTRALEKRVSASERFETLVGATDAMREVFGTIDKLANSDVNVLIQGESGTGKELAARAIHDRSARGDGPFVALNCGAIPEALIDSELFGHTKGAFTGAVGSRQGVFAEANGGTLFLDEIGDIPLQVQLRLLRVLQEREVREVGGTGSRPVDVRVIAATHVDLEAATARKEFRLDLFYRLNVVSLGLPPLRDRLDDVPLLATHLIEKHSARAGRQEIPRVSARAMEALCEYEWPGNVRELENAVQRALAMATGNEVDMEALPRRVTAGRGALAPVRLPDEAPSNGAAPASPSSDDLSWTDGMSFADAKKQAQYSFERSYLERLLQRTGGNISEAARLAGVDRSNLKRVLSRLGLRD